VVFLPIGPVWPTNRIRSGWEARTELCFEGCLSEGALCAGLSNEPLLIQVHTKMFYSHQQFVSYS
jgi:hypothetical protein